MSTIIHSCLDVRGALRRNMESRRKWAFWLTEDNNAPMLREKAIGLLMDELAAGREVLSFGAPCEGWSDKTGCPGHATGATP